MKSLPLVWYNLILRLRNSCLNSVSLCLSTLLRRFKTLPRNPFSVFLWPLKFKRLSNVYCMLIWLGINWIAEKHLWIISSNLCTLPSLHFLSGNEQLHFPSALPASLKVDGTDILYYVSLAAGYSLLFIQVNDITVVTVVVTLVKC
jgi:hypothetical protein